MLGKDFFPDTCTQPAATVIFVHSPFPLRWQSDLFTDAAYFWWQTISISEKMRSVTNSPLN